MKDMKGKWKEGKLQFFIYYLCWLPYMGAEQKSMEAMEAWRKGKDTCKTKNC